MNQDFIIFKYEHNLIRLYKWEYGIMTRARVRQVEALKQQFKLKKVKIIAKRLSAEECDGVHHKKQPRLAQGTGENLVEFSDIYRICRNNNHNNLTVVIILWSILYRKVVPSQTSIQIVFYFQ